jgi:hypothetical protein
MERVSRLLQRTSLILVGKAERHDHTRDIKKFAILQLETDASRKGARRHAEVKGRCHGGGIDDFGQHRDMADRGQLRHCARR